MRSGDALTTVAFVDVVGSTELLERLGDDVGARALSRQLDVVRERLGAHGGREVKSLGDGLLLSFGSARQAVLFAVACQRALRDTAPRVRIGVNAGEVSDLERDPLGAAVNAAARITDRAEGGEVLVSDVVRQLAGSAPLVQFIDRGRSRLRGFAEPWHLWSAVDLSSPRSVHATIGRLSEVAVLDEILTALGRGVGSAVLFEGEAGIGKTHLLDVLAHEARQSTVRVVLRVGTDEVVRRPGEIAHVVSGDERVPSALRSQLGELLQRSGAGGQPEDRSYAVIERTCDAIEVLTRTGAVILVADDLHWADELSLRVLRGVIARTASAPIALVGACRPVPRPVLLDRVVEAVVDIGGRHVRLGPLEELDVQALAAALTGAAPGMRLRDRLASAGGNPLFVSELLRSFDDEGLLRVEAGVAEIAASTTPASVGTTLLRRLSWLPSSTRDLLRLASLLGTGFSLSDLSALTGRSVVDVAAALRDATLAGLVVGDSDRLRFRHDLVREVVYADMLPAERRDLHRAAGAALAQTAASVQRVAQQFLLGATPGDIEAVEWLVRAASEIVCITPSVAIELLESALALAPSTWEGRSRAQAQLVEPLAWCGRFERAEELATSVLATSPEGELAFEVMRGMAAVHGNRGDIASSIEHMQRAVSVPGAPVPEARRLRSFSAQLEAMFGSTSSDTARERVEAELGEAQEVGDVTCQCVAHQALGTIELLEGRGLAALEHLERAMALHESGHVSTRSYIVPDLFHAGTLVELGRIDEALAAADRSRRGHIERGALTQLPLSHMITASAHFDTGRWADADAEIDAGLAVADETGSRNFVLSFRALSARLAIGRGDSAAAEREIQQGLQELAGGKLFGADWLVDAHAELQAVSGDPQSALSTVMVGWEMAAHLRHFFGYGHRCLLLLRLAAVNGRDDLRIVAADCLEEGARRTPSTIAAAFAAHGRGLERGDAALLDEALGLYRTTPFRVRLAECCIDLARRVGADGDRSRAAALLEEAAETYTSVGALGHLARVEEELQHLGLGAGRRPARPKLGWDALTPMELVVSELVAEGLTNPEIGERLHISRRTVESHVAHVFRKLDYSTRSQLAAAVARRGADATSESEISVI